MLDGRRNNLLELEAKHPEDWHHFILIVTLPQHISAGALGKRTLETLCNFKGKIFMFICSSMFIDGLIIWTKVQSMLKENISNTPDRMKWMTT